MEINDFDKLVKEQMSKMEVVPAAGTKKAIAFIMFFNNLFLFHKVKMVAALFLISSSVYVGMNYPENRNNPISEESNAEINDDITIENSLNQNKDVAGNSINEEGDNIVNPQKEEVITQSQNSNNDNINAVEASSNTSKGNVSKEASNSIASNEAKSVLSDEKQSSENNGSTNVDQVVEGDKTISNTSISNNEEAITSKTIVSNLKKNRSLEAVADEEEILQKFDIIDAVVMETEIGLDNSLPSPVVVKSVDDYADNPKKRGFSVDGYFSSFNKVDIDNELAEDLTEYHWDFYKEHGYVKTGSRGGININYNWNNFKIGSGLQLSTLRDYKSIYKYYFMPDSFNGNYFTPAVSGAKVYGEDTTIVFYADPLNNELHKEIEKEYNTYTYLRVPLTLGYEFDFKYLSLELNAGVEYGHLIKATGVEVRPGHVVNDPLQEYFYSDKYMGMMSRKSENLNKHQFAILANATLRVRLTPSFDLYSSINYTQSKSGIYSDDYFLQKTYKNYGAKIGVTYYLNKRLKLKESTTSSF